jgi:hypothetical protein
MPVKFLKRKKKTQPDSPKLNWIEASDNPWGIRVLDLRPITHRMIATSKDPEMAKNSVSYGGDDGTSFIKQQPESKNEIDGQMSFNVDYLLAPGVLFAPRDMDQKWAIFFHHDEILFVRSWLRKVSVKATTSQKNGKLTIEKIKGQFIEHEEAEFTRAIARFILVSYAMQEVVPAPLPLDLSDNLNAAGLWAFSLYGKFANVGLFSYSYQSSPKSILRSNSLLHIATARNDIKEIDQQLENGIPINILAQDGSSPLHWSLSSETPQAMKHLLKLGADPNIRTLEGATPLMMAVQQKAIEKTPFLISSGADVDAVDDRGFTALHRASEMGLTEFVEILLKNNAKPDVEAQEGHTPLSLAELSGKQEIVKMLHKYL